MVTRFLAANLLLPSFFLSLAIMRTAAAATVISQVGTMPPARLMSDFVDKHRRTQQGMMLAAIELTSSLQVS